MAEIKRKLLWLDLGSPLLDMAAQHLLQSPVCQVGSGVVLASEITFGGNCKANSLTHFELPLTI